jgi:anti-anti-sigma regulatory factor
MRGAGVTDSEAIVVECGEVLDISRVAEFYAELKMVIDENKPIELDAANLSRIDAAGVQLLVALCQKAKVESISLTWKQVSESLHRSASLIGLENELGLPQ